MIRKRIHSIKKGLIQKSKESALTAIQVFNNPNIKFKSETFVVLMTIAWTYLFHSYYKDIGVDYRYSKQHGSRKRYDKTNYGAYKHWSLETCINDSHCHIDRETKLNLQFIIGLRHEIEHQMTVRIDDTCSAKFQACCLNYNHWIKEFHGAEFGIDKDLSFSLQLSAISQEQENQLIGEKNLPKSIESFIITFEDGLTEEEYQNPRYAYRVIFLRKLANRKGQADKVIEFVAEDSELGKELNKDYVVIKGVEKKKFRPSQIVKMMNEEGFGWFNMYHHTKLWQNKDYKNPSKGYGVWVAGRDWFWYENWIDLVRDYCKREDRKIEHRAQND